MRSDCDQYRKRLENRERIQRRTGPARHAQRRGHKQECRAIALRCRIRHRLQVEIVEYRHAEARDQEFVQGVAQALDAGGKNVGYAVATDDCNTPRLQPLRRRRMQTRGGFGQVPLAFIRDLHPAAGSEQQHIAARNTDARRLLPGLEVG